MLTRCHALQAKIFHKRNFPRKNNFAYRMFYLAVPLSRLDALNLWPLFGVNRPAIMSFWNKDHGDRSCTELSVWVNAVLISEGIDDANGEIILITLPRLFGYVFNPVSFWLCYKANGDLRAVIVEVNNTFGETHCYVCAGESGQTISSREMYFADKDFHVSPFLRRLGSYRFRFVVADDRLRINIDYFDENQNLQLHTAIFGRYRDWGLANVLASWAKSPLMALKAISLIHLQALKLFLKSLQFQPKPEQQRWFYTRATSSLTQNTDQTTDRTKEDPHVLEYR